MNNYEIFFDLSADIDKDFANRNSLVFIPMQYSLGSEFRTANYLESDEALHEFYESQKNGDLTKTSQITPFQYIEIFTPYLERNIDIIYFTLSSGLSKTYESALVARKELLVKFPKANISIIDSLAATGGLGVLAHKAVELRSNNVEINQATEELKVVASKLRHFFLVSDLNYLKRGGRISATTAFFGNALKLVPILEINKVGKLDTIDKKRGVKAAANQLVEYFKENYDSSNNVIYVTHGDNLEIAEYVKEKLHEINKDFDIHITMLSPIIGAHTGPGMVAICLQGK